MARRLEPPADLLNEPVELADLPRPRARLADRVGPRGVELDVAALVVFDVTERAVTRSQDVDTPHRVEPEARLERARAAAGRDGVGLAQPGDQVDENVELAEVAE